MSMRAYLVPQPKVGSLIGTTYSIPIENISPEDLEDEKKRLTLTPKSNFGPPAQSFPVYSIFNNRFHVPIFYGLQRYGPAETDNRSAGVEVTINFDATLTSNQTRAMDTVFTNQYSESGCGGAIVVLPCGEGKTVYAIACSSRIGRKTAILVHTSLLKTQWKERYEQFCPGIRIGFVQGKVCDVEDKDVVIMMVQTLAKRPIDDTFSEQFGFVVCDEAHHMGAPFLHQSLFRFRPKYYLGITATKDRLDGLTHLLHWSLGLRHFVRRTTEAAKAMVMQYRGASVEKHKDGRPLVASC